MLITFVRHEIIPGMGNCLLYLVIFSVSGSVLSLGCSSLVDLHTYSSAQLAREQMLPS